MGREIGVQGLGKYHFVTDPKMPIFPQSYTTLPTSFYHRESPALAKEPRLIAWNLELANSLKWEEIQPNKMSEEKLAGFFCGQDIPEEANPISQAYAGHQFGHFTMLGDGRAILLGEVRTGDGGTLDVQWKGSGRTKFSRGGDGKATLSSMLREYIMSEAMFGLGIPTTRSLAVVATGEKVLREEVQEGAVLTRIAKSHIRVGTFEYAYHLLSIEELESLFEYTVKKHFPNCLDSGNPPLAFLEEVMKKQVSLITSWMRVGFIHGVMNTDNMSIPGETIDFGPCAFLNGYSAKRVFSSIDQRGRYAFANQVGIAHWNLACLANALLPLIDKDNEEAIRLAKAKLDELEDWMQESYVRMLGEKIGIPDLTSKDLPLLQTLFQWMQDTEADYTNTFLELEGIPTFKNEIFKDNRYKDWKKSWKEELKIRKIKEEDALLLMQKTNPALVPRNHLVENALQNAKEGLLSPLKILVSRGLDPYRRELGYKYEEEEPLGGDQGYQTFCGT